MADDTPALPPWHWPDGPGAARAYDFQLEMERLLCGVRRVFLDVNFWIDCRDAKFGPEAAADKRALYEMLAQAVRDRRLVCPISSDILTELTKQDDVALGQTMAVIDELTLGCAIVPHRERIVIDVERFLGEFTRELAAPHRPIWTAFVFAYGYQDLWPPAPVRRSDDLLVTMTEFGWRLPPSKGLPALRRAVTNAREESERVAAKLNEGADAHHHEVRSFASILKSELAGAADLLSGNFSSEYDRMAAAVGAPPGDDRLKNILTQMAAIGMAKPEGRKAFSNIVVPATLHAAFRAERNRRFKPNDVFDFRHAAAALPNCDAFFTEGKLGRLMASGHVALTSSYSCRVATIPAEALQALRDLDLA